MYFPETTKFELDINIHTYTYTLTYTYYNYLISNTTPYVAYLQCLVPKPVPMMLVCLRTSTGENVSCLFFPLQEKRLHSCENTVMTQIFTISTAAGFVHQQYCLPPN